jgi:hypothetical protein
MIAEADGPETRGSCVRESARSFCGSRMRYVVRPIMW